jgi:predicted  nucleic acid-binding Zn-ribbon protein
MPLNWLTVLKSVPWTEVISTAPKVADGAKKLWKTVARKRAADEAPPIAPPDTEAFSALNARVSALEAAADDLHNQMLASSELIKSLAEQNEQLIARLESQRRFMRWLFVAALAACALAAATLLRMVA